ncbi:hypothetical protein JCM11491_004930 [Sporobolomyces phaffii]
MASPTLLTLRKPLSTAQESRLIRHLDPALLSLSGSFESRHSPASRLGTLAAFLDALVPLLSLVLAVPAARPSGGLRVAYLLQLTGYLAPAIEGYPLGDDSLDTLFAVLDRFDRGWAAVLEGREWDSANGIVRVGTDTGAGSYEVQSLRTTERVRLQSLVHDLRQVLSSSFDLPQVVPLSINPFEQSLGVDVRSRFGPEDDDFPERLPATPELSVGDTTEDDDMSIDGRGEPTNPSDESDAGDYEDSDAEFELVEIVPPPSHRPPSAHHDSIASGAHTSRSSDPDDSPATFEIHFDGPPPPTMTDGEITINSGQTPIVGQRRGFDPDEEYPSEDEEDEEAGRTRMDEGSGRRDVRDKVNQVFTRTREALDKIGEQ